MSISKLGLLIGRYILCPSVLTVQGMGDPERPGHTYTEEDWTDTDKEKMPYIQSKTLAEKAAWEFVDHLPGTVYTMTILKFANVLDLQSFYIILFISTLV